MSVSELYNAFRKGFPELTKQADNEQIRIWGEVDPASAYSWFESLANALNQEMKNDIDVEKYKAVFDSLSRNYQTGNDEVKSCIDVSFTENLFWRVPHNKAKPYWKILPTNLKTLYLNFHKSPPDKKIK